MTGKGGGLHSDSWLVAASTHFGAVVRAILNNINQTEVFDETVYLVPQSTNARSIGDGDFGSFGLHQHQCTGLIFGLREHDSLGNHRSRRIGLDQQRVVGWSILPVNLEIQAGIAPAVHPVQHGFVRALHR
ncbi:MAG TPA: hypothetical protein PKN33_15420 [Phycisphaerae bacterium]|nr:hypothetical protein [Phycisphaerales bacterium]HNO79438.1 hypothetical protein [Phycisphaerae bacterium]